MRQSMAGVSRRGQTDWCRAPSEALSFSALAGGERKNCGRHRHGAEKGKKQATYRKNTIHIGHRSLSSVNVAASRASQGSVTTSGPKLGGRCGDQPLQHRDLFFPFPVLPLSSTITLHSRISNSPLQPHNQHTIMAGPETFNNDNTAKSTATDIADDLPPRHKLPDGLQKIVHEAEKDESLYDELLDGTCVPPLPSLSPTFHLSSASQLPSNLPPARPNPPTPTSATPPTPHASAPPS